MYIKRFYDLAKKAVNAWLDDYAPSMGAAIAFYTVFSMAPLVIIVIAIAGFFWSREAVQGQLFQQVAAMVGADGAKAVESVVQGAQTPTQGIIATAVSVAVLLVGSTTVFAELQSALDRIWEVPAEKNVSGIWNTIRARLLSFGLVLALAFLLIVSLLVSAILSAMGSWAANLLPAWEILLHAINIVVALAFTTALFAMIYRFMPRASVAWRDVWIGAFVTSLLFEIGKFLIGVYVGKASVASSYAAAGSLVVVLIWVYYAAQVFLLGAEFTWVYANEHGSRRNSSKEASQAGVVAEDNLR